MHNENLKFINIAVWDIPRPYRDQEVRQILEKIIAMKPGEVVRVTVPVERVWLLRSAVYRQIKRHDLGAVLHVQKHQLYLRKVAE